VWLGDAASAVAGVDAHTSLLLAIIGLLSTVLVAALGGVASVLVARANRRANEDGTAHIKGLSFHDYVVGELAVNKRRLDDHDEALALFERRQDRTEAVLDIDNVNWRPGHDD
jgi:hypothetical protein